MFRYTIGSARKGIQVTLVTDGHGHGSLAVAVGKKGAAKSKKIFAALPDGAEGQGSVAGPAWHVPVLRHGADRKLAVRLAEIVDPSVRVGSNLLDSEREVLGPVWSYLGDLQALGRLPNDGNTTFFRELDPVKEAIVNGMVDSGAKVLKILRNLRARYRGPEFDSRVLAALNLAREVFGEARVVDRGPDWFVRPVGWPDVPPFSAPGVPFRG